MAFTDFLTYASKQDNPYVRMAYMMAETIAAQYLVVGRTKKPFISLIGETYELITDKFKFFAENVSQFPPIVAFSVQGDGFKAHNFSNARMHFNGTQVEVHDPELSIRYIYLKDGTEEVYSSKIPKMVIGNLIMQSKMYMEPVDELVMTNTN